MLEVIGGCLDSMEANQNVRLFSPAGLVLCLTLPNSSALLYFNDYGTDNICHQRFPQKHLFSEILTSSFESHFVHNLANTEEGLHRPFDISMYSAAHIHRQ